MACAIPTAFSLYLRYKLYNTFKDMAADIRELKKLEENKPFEVKLIAAGRTAQKTSTVKNALEENPKIVETPTEEIKIGTKGEEEVTAETDLLTGTETPTDSLGQNTDTTIPIEGAQIIAVEVVKEMPQFPGGIKGLMTWLDQNIDYPETYRKQKIEGDVNITFVIDGMGMVQDANISKSLHPALDSIALDAVRRMPRWTSTSSAVNVTLPIHFQVK